MKFKWLYFLISSLIIVPGFFSLIKWGLRPSIDFRGGSVLEVKFEKEINSSELEKVIEEKLVGGQVIRMGKENRFSLRSSEISNDEKIAFLQLLKEKFGPVEEIQFASLGPALGKELLIKTFVGILIATLGILIYVSLRFKEKSFGICAILAMLHDSLVLLGVFSLLGYFAQIEVDSLFVTAVLTALAFSVHDTVVVYDRIRELSRLYPKLNFSQLADRAVLQTLSRSINNSMTIIFVLLALFLLGGETIRWFSFALLIGAISGTYSSTFVAVPLLVIWREKLNL